MTTYGISTSNKEYPTLEKARAAARRVVSAYAGFKTVTIYEMKAKGNGKALGTVVYDPSYNYGNASGIFYVPKGKMYDGYRASGVSSDGKLNSVKYRLT